MIDLQIRGRKIAPRLSHVNQVPLPKSAGHHPAKPNHKRLYRYVSLLVKITMTTSIASENL